MIHILILILLGIVAYISIGVGIYIVGNYFNPIKLDSYDDLKDLRSAIFWWPAALIVTLFYLVQDIKAKRLAKKKEDSKDTIEKVNSFFNAFPNKERKLARKEIRLVEKQIREAAELARKAQEQEPALNYGWDPE